ncbi:HDIG domain-containing metalloprotein [Clostridium oceanicum]|uniref:HDIG domain-containing protein n=1 Tax=Clostridium oceanicum TaxID=1543 RepID=A0ABN1JV90_9CLOT
MRKISMNKIMKDYRFKKYLIFFITFICTYVILITGLVTKKYDLKEGDIPKTNIKAPMEIKDESSTKARLNQALEAVTPEYTKKAEVKTEVLNNIKSFFLQVESVSSKYSDKNQATSELAKISKINLSKDQYESILSLDKEGVKKLQEFLINLMSDLYENYNIIDETDTKGVVGKTIKKAQDSIYIKVRSSDLSSNLSRLAETIGIHEIKPNYFYDKEKTEEAKKEVIKNTPPVMIKKGQIIAKEGEPIGKVELEILKELGLLNTSSNFQWYTFISLAALVLLVQFIQWMYLYKYHSSCFENSNNLILISLVNCVFLLLARSLTIISPFLIPLACVPMMLTLLLNHRISLVVSLLNCILIAVAVNFNVEILLISIVSGVLGATFLRKMQQRNDIIYISLYIAVINVILSFSAGFILSNSVIDVGKKALFSFIGSIISAVLTIGFLPLLESTFDIVTTMKLLELSNPNHPLLKTLLIKAPGTYHHSVLVGNLAEVAAEIVGGDPILARVAAYYHDIGKTKRPYFFKENQVGRENPHDKISANLSALIIISHVKDGLEISREHKIPKIIQDIIQQHHGNSLVKYFYITAKNNCERPDQIDENHFRYDGPVPETKEAAIIMLADGVEAAVRSINDPTNEKIKAMVEKIIKDRLDEGQLDNCELTLKNIKNIKESFLKVLTGIYHQRIEYPEDKWIKK